MKLRIAGVTYDYQEAATKVSLRHSRDLKKASGIGPKSVRLALVKFLEAIDENGQIDDEVSEAEDVLLGMQGLVFLCRRHAGETVAFDEIDASYEDFVWVLEESDVPVEPPDPPQAASIEAPLPSSENESGKTSSVSKPSKPKSKTSKPRSTATS